jgi:GNAT superfamily N-acetyltransferase
VSLRFYTAAERFDLREQRAELQKGWPLFMMHDPVGWDRWGSLYREFAELSFFLCDGDELVAEGNSIPVRIEDELPDEGWDWALGDGGRAAGEPNAVSALQVNVLRSRRGAGLSAVMLEKMRQLAVERGFRELVAPVRPSLKSSYPLTPIGRYVEWRRDDGLLFDPWLRTHERLGAELVRVCARSMEIPGTVEEWEEWTSMRFPESGRYVVPGALEPVEIDVEADRGVYVEPNVWMRHRL